MPAAQTRTELIEVTRVEYESLVEALAPITLSQAVQTDMDGDSVKSVIGHRAHWIDLFLTWYEDGEAGRPVRIPVPGHKWHDLNRYNAELRDKQADLSWYDVREDFDERARELIDFIRRLSDGELYHCKLKGTNSNWTVGRWAEAAGAAHYRSAHRYVRRRLREFEVT